MKTGILTNGNVPSFFFRVRGWLLALLAPLLLSAQDPPKKHDLRELITQFMKGSDKVRPKLRAIGRPALHALSEARLNYGDSDRLPNLLDLLHEIKKETTSATDARELFAWLDKRLFGMRVGIKPAPVVDLLDQIKVQPWMSGKRSASIVIDPQVWNEVSDVVLEVDVNLGPRRSLELLTAALKMDFDVRNGVVWIGTPTRLFGRPAKPEKLTDEHRKAVDRLSSGSLEESEAAADRIRAAGIAAIPLLEKHLSSDDPERVARCRDLIRRIRRSRSMEGLRNSWRPARNARISLKPSLTFDEALREIGIAADVPVKEPGLKDPINMNLWDVPVGDALELLTLPRGLDARLEKGVLVIVERKS